VSIATPEWLNVAEGYAGTDADWPVLDRHILEVYGPCGSKRVQFLGLPRWEQINQARAWFREREGMTLPPAAPPAPPEPVLTDMQMLEIERGYQTNQHGLNDAFPYLPRRVDFIKLKSGARYRAFMAGQAGPGVADSIRVNPSLIEPAPTEPLLKNVSVAPDTAPDLPDNCRDGAEPAPPIEERELVTAADGQKYVEETGDSYGNEPVSVDWSKVAAPQ
jgi:hypothetical protein